MTYGDGVNRVFYTTVIIKINNLEIAKLYNVAAVWGLSADSLGDTGYDVYFYTPKGELKKRYNDIKEASSFNVFFDYEYVIDENGVVDIVIRD